MSRAGLAFLVAASAVVAATTAAGAEPPVSAHQAEFAVVNTNSSRVPCPSDSASYTVRASLVGPTDALRSGRASAVTIYVPSFGFSSYWRFAAVPGYDHAAAMAGAGHVSLVYDPLGYGGSDKPEGMDTCLGSSADVLHQVIAKLRSGNYTLDGAPPLSFERVVVASHTSGALITQTEAYSYGDIDGLVVTSWADSGFSPQFWQNTAESSVACATGGEPAEGDGGPGSYTFIPPRNHFAASYFADADDAVVQAAAARQRRAPCGEFASAGATAAENQVLLADIAAPVLLTYGEHDALFDQPSAGEQQRDRFSGAPSVELVVVPGTGSALALERSAPTLRSTMSGWLCAKGLADARSCAPPALRRGTQAPVATDPPSEVRPAAAAAADARQALPSTGRATPAPAAATLLGLALAARYTSRGAAAATSDWSRIRPHFVRVESVHG